MIHSEMEGLYELYVLGTLEYEAAVEIDGHLAEDCEHCREQVRRAVYTTAALAYLAEEQQVPAGVRERLLAGVRPRGAGSSSERGRWFWALPALIAACVALVVVGLFANSRIARTHEQLAQVVSERNELRTALEVLSRTETKTVQYGRADAAPHGRVLVNPSGKVVIVGSEMPTLAAGKTFELWLVPAKGNPVPAGLFHPDAQGGFVHLTDASINAATVAAVAVSVEPEGGSTAPTTKPFLIVPLS